jgi:hypothetical protein
MNKERFKGIIYFPHVYNKPAWQIYAESLFPVSDFFAWKKLGSTLESAQDGQLVEQSNLKPSSEISRHRTSNHQINAEDLPAQFVEAYLVALSEEKKYLSLIKSITIEDGQISFGLPLQKHIADIVAQVSGVEDDYVTSSPEDKLLLQSYNEELINKSLHFLKEDPDLEKNLAEEIKTAEALIEELETLLLGLQLGITQPAITVLLQEIEQLEKEQANLVSAYGWDSKDQQIDKRRILIMMLESPTLSIAFKAYLNSLSTSPNYRQN